MQGGCLGGTRALRCAGSGGVVGEVLEGGERESFPLLLFIWGERFFFGAFTHLVEGDLLLSFSFIG